MLLPIWQIVGNVHNCTVESTSISRTLRTVSCSSTAYRVVHLRSLYPSILSDCFTSHLLSASSFILVRESIAPSYTYRSVRLRTTGRQRQCLNLPISPAALARAAIDPIAIQRDRQNATNITFILHVRYQCRSHPYRYQFGFSLRSFVFRSQCTKVLIRPCAACLVTKSPCNGRWNTSDSDTWRCAAWRTSR